MRSLYKALLLSMSLASFAPAQTLQRTSDIKTDFQGFATIDRASCDKDGNHYIRTADVNTLLETPIQKVRADGSLGESFKGASAFPQFWFWDFFIADSGDLYLVGEAHPGTLHQEYYILRFSRDAVLKSTTRIDVGVRSFRPEHLAVFKTGEILVTGTSGNLQNIAVAAVFDANGNLLNNIYEPAAGGARLTDSGDDANNAAQAYDDAAGYASRAQSDADRAQNDADAANAAADAAQADAAAAQEAAANGDDAAAQNAAADAQSQSSAAENAAAAAQQEADDAATPPDNSNDDDPDSPCGG
jgi:hypothetical protein